MNIWNIKNYIFSSLNWSLIFFYSSVKFSYMVQYWNSHFLVDRKNSRSNRFSKTALHLTRNPVVSIQATLTSWILLTYIFLIVSSCLWRVWIYGVWIVHMLMSAVLCLLQGGRVVGMFFSISFHITFVRQALYLNFELGWLPALSHESSLPHSAMRWL